MGYAAGQMSGNCYPTVRVARCPSYHACELCTGCTKYDPHNMDCTVCESRKPIEWLCVHTDKQQWTKKRIDERMKRPMYHPDTKPSTTSYEIAYDNVHTNDVMELAERFRPAIKETIRRV